MTRFLFVVLTIVHSFSCFSQEQVAITLPTTSLQYDEQSQVSWLDILAEMRRLKMIPKNSPVSIQKVILQAKAGIGGAVVALRLNDEFVATQSIDTESEDFDNSSTGFIQVELKNIKDGQEAAVPAQKGQLIVKGWIHLAAIQVFLGEASLVAWTNEVLPPPRRQRSPYPASVIVSLKFAEEVGSATGTSQAYGGGWWGSIAQIPVQSLTLGLKLFGTVRI